MRGWRLVVWLGLGFMLLWAMRTPLPPQPRNDLVESRPEETTLGKSFDATQCGTVECIVEWQGEVPTVPELHLNRPKTNAPDGKKPANPNAPQVSANGGLADAAIRLRGVDLAKSRPWRHEPTTIEIADNDLRVRPAFGSGRFGIVRRGSTVRLVSREPLEHSVRGRGASFFNQMLFAMDQPVDRQLSNEGIVELDSGTWFYWHHAYLIVSDHPYVGVSGRDGKLQLDQVPAGEYEIACWKANWHIAEIERDREWLSQSGVVFEPAVEKRQTVRVVAGQKTQVKFRFQTADFVPRVNSNK